LESIVGTDFNFGVVILCYTHKEFMPRLLPVWAGQAHESIVFKNCCFMPHFSSSPFGTGGLL